MKPDRLDGIPQQQQQIMIRLLDGNFALVKLPVWGSRTDDQIG
jgi:hypothetical protein